MSRIPSVFFVVLLTAASLQAQTTANGSVRGVVTDEQGAVLPGVSVVATSEAVPGEHAATTDARGRYRLVDLPPGDYTIVATLPSFEARDAHVAVRAGVNLQRNVVMTVGSVSETIAVTQETPLLETQNAVRAVNVSGELLRSIPLSERREWFGALMLAPGVTTAEWANNDKLFYVHGADASANIVQIDGADVSPAFASGVEYIGLNTDAIDDIQIKTAGLDASAPLGVGGIINIATASGTNELKGAAVLLTQPQAWNASNTPGGISSTVDQLHTDLSAGGPLLTDRLWAFGAYRYTNVSSGVSRTAAQLDALRALIPGYEPLDNTNDAHLWFVKLTAQPSARHQLSGFAQADVNPVRSASARAEHPEEEATGGMAASVRLSSVWSNRLTTRVAASYNDKRRDGQDPAVDAPLEIVYRDTLASGGVLVGNGELARRGSPSVAWGAQPNSKLTLSLDATLFADGASGTHELQAGVYLQPRIRVGFDTFYVNDGFALEQTVLRDPNRFDAGVQPFRRVVFAGSHLTAARRHGEDYAVYIQDAWRPVSRLTLNAGLRVDRIVWRDRLFDVTSQRSTEIGPRFGVNYLLTADGRNIARAHWVRVHDQPSRNAISVGTTSLGQQHLYDVNLDGVFETVFETPPTFRLTPDRTVDPGLHQAFVHEWGAGYSRQLPGNVAVGVDVVRREYRDRPVMVETNGRYDDHVFVGYEDESFNEIFRIANNEWNWPVYSSLEVSFTKRTARVQAVASYVRQWRHMAGTWQPNDPASFIQPGAFGNNKGIGTTTGLDSLETNSLSGISMTQSASASAQWQDHVVRVGVAHDGPWGLLLAGNYTFQSGAWSGPIISRAPAPDPSFGPPTVTLSNGRVVQNPLATTFRFAYPTRGDGQLRTPVLHVWNLRVGRRFSWGARTIDAALDVFNVTNNDADLSFDSGANQTFNHAFGTTRFRQLPRSAQVVVRVSF